MELCNTTTYTGNLTFGMELITPEKAAEYLKMNRKNRRILDKKVAMYSMDMINGNFQSENGETISFYQSGTLKDGQHRLKAVVKSGVANWFLVVRGVADDKTICDRGRPRTTQNVMELDGYLPALRNSVVIAGVRLLYQIYKSNEYEYLSDSEIEKFIDKNREIILDCFHASIKGADNVSLTKTAPVFGALLVARANGTSASVLTDFCCLVNTGLSKSESQFAAIQARKMLESNKGVSTSDTRRETFRRMLMAIDDFEHSVPRTKKYSTIKPTRAERNGKYLLFDEGGSNS